MKSLHVQLQQVAAKTDVEGRAGLLCADLRLASVHVDVGTGDVRHQSGWAKHEEICLPAQCFSVMLHIICYYIV